jgi:hypothetical protein
MLLRARDPREHVIVRDTSREDDDTGFEKIRCPLCDWRPSPADTWCCLRDATPEPPFQSCGTVWNTFATQGRCPGCLHQWRWTSCLSCGGWSLHQDWYCEE